MTLEEFQRQMDEIEKNLAEERAKRNNRTDLVFQSDGKEIVIYKDEDDEEGSFTVDVEDSFEGFAKWQLSRAEIERLHASLGEFLYD